MYEIETGEALIRTTEHILQRKNKRNITFRVLEILAPEIEKKYVVTPKQVVDMDQPKEEFVVQGSNQVEVVNKFISLTRNIEKTGEMFNRHETETEAEPT